MNDKAPAAPAVGLEFNGTFSVGAIHLRATDNGIEIRNEKVGSPHPVKAGKSKNPFVAPSGFGASGELRVGAITLAISSDYSTLRLRRENVGHQTQVDAEIFADLIDTVFFSDEKNGQPATREIITTGVEGILEDAFFTRRIEKDGTVKTNLDRVRTSKA